MSTEADGAVGRKCRARSIHLQTLKSLALMRCGGVYFFLSLCAGWVISRHRLHSDHPALRKCSASTSFPLIVRDTIILILKQ